MTTFVKIVFLQLWGAICLCVVSTSVYEGITFSFGEHWIIITLFTCTCIYTGSLILHILHIRLLLVSAVVPKDGTWLGWRIHTRTGTWK